MSNNQYYDERQLIERGKIMQESFFLLAILIIINAFLYGFNFIWADYVYSQMIVVLISVCYCTIRMIWKDAYNNVGSKFNVGLISSSLLGLLLLWSNIKEMSRDNMGFLWRGKLTANGAGIIIGSGIMLICVVNLVKILKDKWEDKDE